MNEVVVDFSSFVDLIDDFVGLFQGEEEMKSMDNIVDIQEAIRKQYQMKIQESDAVLHEMEKSLNKLVSETTNPKRKPYLDAIEKLEERKATLLNNIKLYKEAIEKYQEQIRLCDESVQDLKKSKEDGTKLESHSIEKARKKLALYKSSSSVVFDLDSDIVIGTILNREDCDLFEIDPNMCSSYEITNQIWDQLDLLCS